MAKIEHERLSGITYEQELEILAEVYRLALESYRKRKKEAAARAASDEAKGPIDARPAKPILPR